MPTGKQLAFTCERDRNGDPEHILKALNSLQTPEEKLAALCKKYADLHEEHRLLQGKFKQGQKTLTSVIREKDQLQTEHSKAVLAKSKLESLCRELQRHNKLVKEESLARAREEEEKRKEVTSNFQNTIGEIQSQMDNHYGENTKLREENVELANKMKGLIKQYETREQHIEKVIKHKELYEQLLDARLAQSNLQLKEEQEKNTAERQLLVQEAAESHQKVSLLEEQEKQLRAQVALYAEKYEEFQDTLSKSNDVFQSFKMEMDKMTKKIKKLEKETVMWRSRWENSNRALLEMAEVKTNNDKEIQTLHSKVKKLESLCRALQQLNKKGEDAPAEGLESVIGDAQVSSEPTAESTPGDLKVIAEPTPCHDTQPTPCCATEPTEAEDPSTDPATVSKDSPDSPIPENQEHTTSESSTESVVKSSASESSPDSQSHEPTGQSEPATDVSSSEATLEQVPESCASVDPETHGEGAAEVQ